nr:uncharacterized protein LOC109158743 [Ipomoea trifida]
MLSSTKENQQPAGVSTEEADLLKRSNKNTKRGQAEREDEPMEIEEMEHDETMPKTTNLVEEQTGTYSQPMRRPAISFKGALTGRKEKERDNRRDNGRNTGGRSGNATGRNGGNQGNNRNNYSKEGFNKKGFKIWDNSRFGVLENLEEDSEQEAQEEYNTMDRPNGPTGAGLSGKGKRPQVQITEAQITNDKSGRDIRGERSRNTEKSKKHANQAADMDSHTVVRGYENGNRVETTVVTEEGSATETTHTQPDTHNHHQDPPDRENMDTGEQSDPMNEVVFTEGQSTADPSAVAQ